MYIRTRLQLSYIAMLVLPIVLLMLATAGIYHYYKAQLEKTYQVTLSKHFEDTFVEAMQGRFEQLKEVAINQPETFENAQYLANLDSQLSEVKSGVIIRKGDAISHLSPFLEGHPILEGLPPFGSFQDHRPSNVMLGKHMLAMLQQDFYFSHGQRGTLFLITDITPIRHTFAKFAISEIVAALLILAGTNTGLAVVVSRSIVKSLDQLKLAADQIKQGNLEHHIQVTSKDEVGDLAKTLEEMRVKLKEAEHLRQQYENNRKELITSISHDLKTPITAVRGYVEGVMDGVADTPEKLDKYMKTIYAKATDLDKLIDELLLFSKLDINKLPFNVEEVELIAYLEDCIEELQLDVQQKSIQITFENPVANKLYVYADREKLKRVMTNIVENAIKYMDKEQGQIVIKLTTGLIADEAQVEIRDNGMGMPAQLLPRIFERFYRGDPSRSRDSGGSGLGLAIVKLIVEELGGRVWATSQEGVGTSMFFTLKQVEGRAGEECS